MRVGRVPEHCEVRRNRKPFRGTKHSKHYNPADVAHTGRRHHQRHRDAQAPCQYSGQGWRTARGRNALRKDQVQHWNDAALTVAHGRVKRHMRHAASAGRPWSAAGGASAVKRLQHIFCHGGRISTDHSVHDGDFILLNHLAQSENRRLLPLRATPHRTRPHNNDRSPFVKSLYKPSWPRR